MASWTKKELKTETIDGKGGRWETSKKFPLVNYW